MTAPAQGSFVTFEGIDGCGKSTQAKLLHKALRAAGTPAIWTREPGGSPGAEDIRRLLVEGDPARWSPETEILLFAAARRDHLERTVLPALASGHHVICDRFTDSTRVYQGLARADLRATVDALHALIIPREPDLTFILDLDPETALARGLARKSGEDRFEDMGLDFQARARDGFRALAAEFPGRAILIDATGTPDRIAADIAARFAASAVR